MNPETIQLIEDAEKVYHQNFDKITWFERAVFLSWYCSLGDCTFCYMSTQKNKIKDPKMARRRTSSVLAELLLSKHFLWEIEFLSAGYGSYTNEELLKLLEQCYIVNKDKLWLNIGYLNENEVENFLPYIKGVSVSIETVNWDLRKKVCPSKPVNPMLETLKLADKYNLKKSMTIIIGLGETIEDIDELFKFIKEYKIDRVTFYSLNPHEGTPFTESPKIDYYVQWIARTRIEFPKLEIVAGSWVDKIDEIHYLLKSGANAFTKFPALKLFGTKYAKQIEEEVTNSNRELLGSLTKLPKIDWNQEVDNLSLNEELKLQIKLKLKQYLKRMERNII